MVKAKAKPSPPRRIYVEVVSLTTGEVVKQIGPLSPTTADKVEGGVLINLNADQFYTRQVRERA